MTASDLVAIIRFHGSLHSCAPYNMHLLCVGLARDTNRRILLTVLARRAGAVVRCVSAAPVGALLRPRHCKIRKNPM